MQLLNLRTHKRPSEANAPVVHRRLVLPFSVGEVCLPSVGSQEQSEVSSSSQARQKLKGLLNKNMRIRMTDGRTLVGLFLCTDRDCNVILGSAQEFLKSTGRCRS